MGSVRCGNEDFLDIFDVVAEFTEVAHPDRVTLTSLDSRGDPLPPDGHLYHILHERLADERARRAAIVGLFAAGIALAALSVFLFYRYSENFLRRLGRAGAQTISKISAFILLAIGVQIIWDGIRGLLGLP